MANGQHDVRIVQPRQNIISSTRLIYVYKRGDHYDACLPTNSQTKRQYFVDTKKNFLPLAERIETEINQNDCIDPSSRQVKVSCSDENLNHMQSKYVPHHVSSKAKIAHLNTRSLYPKIDEIRCILDKNNFDIFCVSETWLHKYIKNDEIRIPGYNVFRKDRTTGVGGGVCIYVKETMHVNMRADLMFENIEAIWVEIRQGDTKYLVSCIYRPPSATTEYYERIVDMFECARMTEHPVISLGDLNFNYIMDETLSTNPIHYIETAYDCTSWSTNQHEWMIKPPLCYVILTSHPALHRKSAVLKYTLSDHYLIYTHMKFEHTKPSVVDHNTVKFRDMKNFDMESFSNDLISCDIRNGSQDNDDISWERWKLAYTDICDRHAPMKSLRLKKRSNPWMTHDIIKLMYERDYVHAKATQSNDSKLWQDYRNLRNKVTCIIKERKNAYFNDIHTLCRNDPKKMWSEIKRLVPGKNKHSHITCDISANDFNHHFANIGKKMNSKFQNYDDNFLWKGPKSIYSFRFKNMSKEDIETYLGSLPNKSNNDILGMDLVLLRKSAPYISISLANVINKSLSSGVFEQDWKNARVTPIYKDDGDINDENNYRPISVIGHIAKMIESLVSYQIIDFLEEHSFISMDQSAYLKRHSTQTSLHRVIDDWLENVNDGAITGACLLDISKCFDSINHKILLKKLEMYGITSTELKWFSSYLSGRKQVVKFHQETSEFCDITCGVPQGSVLGPILFLSFINDISNFTVEGCVLNMYADDVIIYTSATSKDELESRLQVCIDNISNWYSMNKLCINKKKSNVMVIGSKWQLKSLNLDDFTISVDSDKLFLASQAKYLGLWVRNDLSWDDHILELCRKMYYYFHMFRRLRKILPSALLLNIYKTYVQSKIDYGLSIWGCTT